MPATKLLSLDMSTGMAQLQAPDGTIKPLPTALLGGPEALKQMMVNKGLTTPEEFDAAARITTPNPLNAGTPSVPLQASLGAAPTQRPIGISTPTEGLGIAPAAGAAPLAASLPADAPAAVDPAAIPPTAAPVDPAASPDGYADEPPPDPLMLAGLGRLGSGVGGSTSGPMGDIGAVERKARADEKSFKAATEDARLAIDASASAQREILQKQAFNEQDSAALHQDIMEKRNRIVADHAATVAAIQNERAEDLQRRQERRDQGVRELANMAVRPEKFFSDRGTAATIGMAIAAGLGAFASSINGGTNYALKIIEDAVARDVQAQLAQIENKRADIATQDSGMSRAIEMFGLKENAALALKAAAYESARDQIDVLTLHMDGLSKKLRGDELRVALDQKVAMEKMALAEADSKASSQVTQVLLSAAQTRTQNAWHTNEAMAALLKGHGNAYIPETRYKVDGRKAPLPDKEEAQVLRKDYGNIKALTKTAANLKQLMQVMEESGDSGIADRALAKLFPGSKYSTAQSYLTALILQLKDVHHLGAFDKGVENVGVNYFGSPTSLRSDFMSKLDAAINSELDKWDSRLSPFEMESEIKRFGPSFTHIDSGTSAR